jgi:hypothetical protein
MLYRGCGTARLFDNTLSYLLFEGPELEQVPCCLHLRSVTQHGKQASMHAPDPMISTGSWREALPFTTPSAIIATLVGGGCFHGDAQWL